MIRKGHLVRSQNSAEGFYGAVVLTDAYCVVIQEAIADGLSESISSREVLVVDILLEGEIYNKVPINTLERIRKDRK